MDVRPRSLVVLLVALLAALTIGRGVPSLGAQGAAVGASAAAQSSQMSHFGRRFRR